ncbi:ribosome small subunit-dependent GTPase A [Brevibacillus fluminis]|uniref:ribosome small subunit-dependent GTPase A n=1 Tax=Brevibacillus fluminis TaxID=511487 RepID=UPI003F8A09C0
MPEGRIVKALSGFYYVADGDKIVSCRARGLFKKKDAKINPLVGDWVVYEETDPSEGYVMEIVNRQNELLRPSVANVDQAVLVFSLHEPSFSSLLLDKFLVHVEHVGIDALIVLSKADLVDDELIERIVATYSAIGYTVIPFSKRDLRGLEEIRRELAGHINVFAGQSGVGKSSLINCLFPNVSMQTGDISQKLGRGRHTTRHVELVPIEGGGYVADTPGFSSLEFVGIDEQDLANSFRDFTEVSDGCKFRGCLHLSEPGCAVRAGVEAGELSQERYDHYRQFMEEVKEYQRRNKPW